MLGLLCAPEERLGHAAAPDMSLTEKRASDRTPAAGAWTGGGIIDWGKTRSFAEKRHRALRRAHAGAGRGRPRALSGGNLQKFS